MTKETCDDCGTTKGLVGDLRGMLCSECMHRRTSEHLEYLGEELKKGDEK